MPREIQRRRHNHSSRNTDVLWFAAAALVLVGVLAASLYGSQFLGGPDVVESNPFGMVFGLLEGRQAWSLRATVIAVLLTLLIVGVAALFVKLGHSSSGKRHREDHAARKLAGVKDVAHLQDAGARENAARLTGSIDPALKGSERKAALQAIQPGIPLGKAVMNGRPLYASWEDMMLLLAGPRTQKTTSYAIPMLLAAPGAALATSNKRDLVDATREPRSNVGQCWVMDIQQVANEPATWWWDPLSYITVMNENGRIVRTANGLPEVDEARATKLAGQFAMSARESGVRADYWEGEAQNLLGYLLLAAAVKEEPITRVLVWLNDPSDTTPSRALAAAGLYGHATMLDGLMALTDRQRDGVYGTARSFVPWLATRKFVEWITPNAARDEFVPITFAQSTDTLYLLSKEGQGSAGPIVAALTVAVTDALEEVATKQPGGRLETPFVGVLDEAANICKFRGLDGLYSHFGSRGILLLTILQSWAQGVEVWGDHGMEKLWSSANIRLYGGGVDDDRFLDRLSKLVGSVDEVTWSHGTSRDKNGSSRSSNRQVNERVVFTPAQLREFSKGRALLFASGTPAVLTQPVPWWDGPHKTEIEESIRKWDTSISA